jgi:hypothetical protein
VLIRQPPDGPRDRRPRAAAHHHDLRWLLARRDPLPFALAASEARLAADPRMVGIAYSLPAARCSARCSSSGCTLTTALNVSVMNSLGRSTIGAASAMMFATG